VRRLDELLEARARFGVRLGLERMEQLLSALGHPERRFRAVHIVGTNGKSSTARFTAAILAAHGLRAGAYLSPHVVDVAERVQLGGAPIDAEILSDAVEAVERAAAGVEGEEDRLTQFEVLTAAAFVALADAGAEAVAVEAGLGGRYDATNVLAAPVVVLTNVALDHTELLGGTRAAIAAEKLAVVPPGGQLVAGGVDAAIAACVVRLAAGRGAAGVELLPAGADVPHAPPLAAAGRFQRENLALALAASRRLLGEGFREDLALEAAAAVVVPGRLQTIDEEPLTLLDGAHNPHGAAALLAEADTLLAGRQPRVAVVALLADKDAAAILRLLPAAVDAVVATAGHSARAVAPEALAAAARAVGLPVEVEADPAEAVRRARDLAGPGGAVLAFGSLTLAAALLAAAPATAEGPGGA
jgi:dihydrofolate synthase/folylpolyglutamate synthase